MTQVDIKYLEDKDGNQIAPITHVNAVRDDNGDTLPEILDRDYPTTSKTPSEGSSEVSLVTRGEKYDYDKVNNATSISSASGIGANLKYILLNGTTGEFEAALGSYVEEKVRAALGSLLNNLDKGTGVKAVAGIDNNNDLGSVTLSNLASVLGVSGKVFACSSVMVSSDNQQIQKIHIGTRQAGLLLYNGNNTEVCAVLVLTKSASSAAAIIKEAKYLLGTNSALIPDIYYNNYDMLAIKFKELWGSFVYISSYMYDAIATVNSDLTGFTEITIQQ